MSAPDHFMLTCQQNICVNLFACQDTEIFKSLVHTWKKLFAGRLFSHLQYSRKGGGLSTIISVISKFQSNCKTSYNRNPTAEAFSFHYKSFLLIFFYVLQYGLTLCSAPWLSGFWLTIPVLWLWLRADWFVLLWCLWNTNQVLKRKAAD